MLPCPKINFAPPLAVLLVTVQPLGAVTVPDACARLPVRLRQPARLKVVAVWVLVNARLLAPLVNVAKVFVPVKVTTPAEPESVRLPKIRLPPANVLVVALVSLMRIVLLAALRVRPVVVVLHTVPVPDRVNVLAPSVRLREVVPGLAKAVHPIASPAEFRFPPFRLRLPLTVNEAASVTVCVYATPRLIVKQTAGVSTVQSPLCVSIVAWSELVGGRCPGVPPELVAHELVPSLQLLPTKNRLA